MIPTNAHLFIDYRWKIKLAFAAAQWETAQQRLFLNDVFIDMLLCAGQ